MDRSLEDQYSWEEHGILIAEGKKKRKNSCIVIDEGGISLFSRESLSKGNKMLAKTFMIQRFLCVCTIICIPYYWNLDKLVRQHRVNTLITVKKRGYYFTVVGKGISILNKLGMKSPDKNLWAIPIPYGLFWEGVFRKPFPNTLDEGKYNKRKLNYINDFLIEAKTDAKAMNMIKIDKLEKEYDIPQSEMIKSIKNGEIDGKKIGNSYFITKKEWQKIMRC